MWKQIRQRLIIFALCYVAYTAFFSTDTGRYLSELALGETGSFQNCTADNDMDTSTILDSESSGTITVSCHKIKFRAPLESFNNQISILVGVLSSASGSGPIRRQSIRDTWASGHSGVFFLVAGPWEDIQEEYETKGDLLWIDEEEVYDGERSVLTLKTYSFIAIATAAAEKYKYDYTHLFKTDDDSYVNLDALYHGLTPDVDYIGQCQHRCYPVHREKEYKWPLRVETYPEAWFPRYCQGAGFALSRKFATCAASDNISNVRFMPFEDVAVGLLAERCNIQPAYVLKDRFHIDRYFSAEARNRVRIGDKHSDDLVPPPACMKNKIMQHRIIDEEDMKNYHQTVLDPEYCHGLEQKNWDTIAKLRSSGVKFYG